MIGWRRAIPLAAGLMALTAAEPIAQEEPITWSLAATPVNRPLKRGDRITAGATAVMQQGWHLYSTSEIRGGPKPTSITVPGGAVFELAGVVESPEPKREFDRNFGTEVEFYEDAVTFTLPLRVRTTPQAATNNLQVQVRFQACNDRICLAPRTVALTAPVR